MRQPEIDAIPAFVPTVVAQAVVSLQIIQHDTDDAGQELTLPCRERCELLHEAGRAIGLRTLTTMGELPAPVPALPGQSYLQAEIHFKLHHPDKLAASEFLLPTCHEVQLRTRILLADLLQSCGGVDLRCLYVRSIRAMLGMGLNPPV